MTAIKEAKLCITCKRFRVTGKGSLLGGTAGEKGCSLGGRARGSDSCGSKQEHDPGLPIFKTVHRPAATFFPTR